MLTINAGVHLPEHMEDYWTKKSTGNGGKAEPWLPKSFGVSGGEEDLRIDQELRGEGVAVYDLRVSVWSFSF